MFEEKILELVHNIHSLCLKHNLKISTAESCTGGIISAALTEIEGASKIFDRGFVIYSNQAKKDLLEVSEKLFLQYGAVSQEVAKAMAAGAVYKSLADVSVAVTGIAGPTTSDDKPIGLVFVATNLKLERGHVRKFHFEGTRSEIRKCSLIAALNLLRETIEEYIKENII